MKAKEVDESGFVTIDDGEDDLEDQSDSSGEKIIETKVGLGQDMKNIPYTPIFSDLDKVFEEVS